MASDGSDERASELHHISDTSNQNALASTNGGHDVQPMSISAVHPASFSSLDLERLYSLFGVSDDYNKRAIADFLHSCQDLITIEDIAFLKEEHFNDGRSHLSFEIQQRLLILAEFLGRARGLSNVDSALSKTEKASMFSPENGADYDGKAIVALNVGGIKYETTRGVLCNASDSALEIMFSGRHHFPALQDEDASFLIERDGTHFQHILNYLRLGTAVPLPSDEDVRDALCVEADYYGLDGLVRLIRMPEKIDIEETLDIKTRLIRMGEQVLREAFMDGTAASINIHEGLVPFLSYEKPIDQSPLEYEPIFPYNCGIMLMDSLREDAAAGVPVAVKTLKEFQSNFDRNHPNVLDRLAHILSEEKVVIAGGSVLRALTGSPGIRTAEWWGTNSASDVDIFLYCDTPVEANEVAKRIFFVLSADDEHWLIMRGNGVITMQSFHDREIIEKVQIILRLYDSPTEVLVGFDCDCCCCAYDGRTVWMAPRCLDALRTGCNVLNPLHSWPNKASYELRLVKYAYRGFAVAVPGLREKYVDCNRILRTEVRAAQGLTRLLRVVGEMSTPTQNESFPDVDFRQITRSLIPEAISCFKTLGGYESGNNHVFIPDLYLEQFDVSRPPLASACRDAAWNEIVHAQIHVPTGVCRFLADAWDTEKRSREYLNSGVDKFDLDNAYYCQAYRLEE